MLSALTSSKPGFCRPVVVVGGRAVAVTNSVGRGVKVGANVGVMLGRSVAVLVERGVLVAGDVRVGSSVQVGGTVTAVGVLPGGPNVDVGITAKVGTVDVASSELISVKASKATTPINRMTMTRRMTCWALVIVWARRVPHSA
jgi:hypothetical protein